jgi:hypothetical protein
MNVGTSRRAALQGAAVAAAAGFLGTAATASAMSTADARLIRLSGELVQVQRAVDALCARRTTIAMEEATDPEMIALCDRIVILESQIEALEAPTTLAGAMALTCAALASAPRTNHGEILVEGWPAWAVWTVLEFFSDTGQAAA